MDDRDVNPAFQSESKGVGCELQPKAVGGEIVVLVSGSFGALQWFQ